MTKSSFTQIEVLFSEITSFQPIVKICQSPADICQNNPAHLGDLVVGIFSDCGKNSGLDNLPFIQ